MSKRIRLERLEALSRITKTRAAAEDLAHNQNLGREFDMRIAEAMRNDPQGLREMVQWRYDYAANPSGGYEDMDPERYPFLRATYDALKIEFAPRWK
jgi:hypothetical protein